MSYQQIVSDSRLNDCYEIEFESKKYQVEVEILEDTEKYIHVGISVDDGALPASLRPIGASFIRNKE